MSVRYQLVREGCAHLPNVVFQSETALPVLETIRAAADVIHY
ncbi:MAG: hypothetical protein ACI4OO_06365 [Otoolea sp.]|nr:hypothetical protein [Clostridium sp.]MDY5483286.1 hypothetical protein [Clostridium sp.]